MLAIGLETSCDIKKDSIPSFFHDLISQKIDCPQLFQFVIFNIPARTLRYYLDFSLFDLNIIRANIRFKSKLVIYLYFWLVSKELLIHELNQMLQI